MSDSGKKKPPSSGEQHPAVAAFHRKADSLRETALPLLTALNERIQSVPPPRMHGPSSLKQRQWAVTISGFGPLHNTQNPSDANRLVALFIKALRGAGHIVSHASITHGEEDGLTEPDEYLAALDAVEGVPTP